MKPHRFKLLLLLTLLALSSCHEFTSPQGVIGTAYQALLDDDLKLWRQSLRDPALAQEGSEAGMCTFQKRLLGQDINLKDPVFMHADDDLCGRPVQKTYHAEVWGKLMSDPHDIYKVIIQAEVMCDYEYFENHCENKRIKSILCQIAELL